MSANPVNTYHIKKEGVVPFGLFDLLMRIMQGARRIQPQHAPFTFACQQNGTGEAVSELTFHPRKVFPEGQYLLAKGTVESEGFRRPARLLASSDPNEDDILYVEIGAEDAQNVQAA